MREADIIALSNHLLVYKNKERTVGVLHHNGKAIIIDIADGGVMDWLSSLHIKEVEGVLLTHHHRDIAYGAHKMLVKGAWIGAPEAERAFFEHTESYWQDPRGRWHLYNFRPNFVLPYSIPVHRPLKDGYKLMFGPARITALSTPGHTDGSMSYLLEVDGQSFAFCGDLIYDKGKIRDIYSLQRGFGGLTDYHGFMSAWQEVTTSLKKLLKIGVDVLIPSSGRIIYEPQEAVELLEKRLKRCYENYLATSALWHYFPQLISCQTSQFPLLLAKTCPTPSFLRHIGTSWILLSEGGNAFVMDCGSEEVISKVEEWVDLGEIKSVDALWITHIHDDHTDAVGKFRQRFSCQVIAEDSVAKVVSRPSAWKLPCLSPNPAPVDRIVKHGESWQWKEFTLTANHFPGQSLYHSGLLVEGRELRLFFSGDSLTPTGLDDYCSYNRNFLSEDRGYDFCLSLLERIQPNMIFNSHIDRPFSFSRADLRTLKKQLKTRKKLFQELLPWEDPNYGLDPYWAYCYPYEQEVRRGETAWIEVVITNHLPRTSRYSVKVAFPPSWKEPEGGHIAEGEAEENEEIRIPLCLKIPLHITAGRIILTVDVWFNGLLFPQFAEFIIDVKE